MPTRCAVPRVTGPSAAGGLMMRTVGTGDQVRRFSGRIAESINQIKKDALRRLIGCAP
jgi:hypothetical protein